MRKSPFDRAGARGSSRRSPLDGVGAGVGAPSLAALAGGDETQLTSLLSALQPGDPDFDIVLR